MNRGAAALHRLSIALIGALCVVIAVAVVLTRFAVDPVSRWVSRIDTDAVADTTGATWFTAVIAAVVLVALYWAWRLIRTTVAPHRPDVLTLPDSGPEGTLTVPLQEVARAVEEKLSSQTVLRQVRVQAVDDRGAKIVRIVVEARPERSYDEIIAILADPIESLREAFAGTDVHVQAMVHFDRLEK
ncbi:hypothetical protein [Gordonia hydrophobica]|uniref:Alkaline shock response membrane anchor protein AmaP n=1 Tax=Gordonia hydrophobica TaxID=40516 RepID=A0ABZ2U7Y6_9ACTN|nr:hypothetical protein [Gordonia hydrophobica]MBM7366143.1 putative membrane protein YeaQ/YmgE (transglycosylase-associated protein family) [Gordonia hydrophobica]